MKLETGMSKPKQEDKTVANLLLTGRKAESIYTAIKKIHADHEKRKAACAVRHSIDSYEEHVRRNAAAKACYVYINGISMPVLSA